MRQGGPAWENTVDKCYSEVSGKGQMPEAYQEVVDPGTAEGSL